MSVGNLEALKTLDQGFKESKIKQLQAFLEDQRELNVRLRKCSFDSAKPSSNNAENGGGKAHRLRPLSARPSTAEAPPQLQSSDQNDDADDGSDDRERKNSIRSSKSRRPSTACGFRSISEEFDTSEDESVFDALSITSLQSGTPSIGELGDIDELDEALQVEDGLEAGIQGGHIVSRRLSQSSALYAAKPPVGSTEPYDDNSDPSRTGLGAKPTVGDAGRRLSSTTTTIYAQGGKAKSRRKSRRKSASNVKHSQLRSLQSSSHEANATNAVESNTISEITTIECPAALYKKIRHHSAPATRNDEIVARMNQQSKRPIGLVCLPPLASEKTTNPARRSSADHSLLPNSRAEFIRTQPMLKTESIL